jgi:hypothetical protein
MAAIALNFAACSDQNDVVDNLIDEIKERPVVKNFPYTLVAADYSTISKAAVEDAGDNAADKKLAEAVKTTNSLNSFADPLKYIPVALAAKYSALGLESAIRVTYAYTPDYLAGLTTNPPASDLMDIYTENFDAMTVNDPVPGWTQFDKTGTRQWLIKTYTNEGKNFAEVTSYGNPKEKNDVWLVSPSIDLSAVTEAVIMFGAEVRYPVAGQNYLKVWASKNFDPASPQSATWTELTSNFTLPTAGTGSSAPAGAASLNSFTGGKVNIAFEYMGDGTVTPALATTFRLDNFRVAEGSVVNPKPGEVYIQDPDKGWVVLGNGIALTSADYTAMGISSLTAATAPNYLPVFLAQKFPYAQQGDRKAILYGANRDEYIYTGGKWTPTLVGGLITDQYVNDGEKWIFDPTVNLTMAKPDHQIMVDYVKNSSDRGEYYLDNYPNSEFRSEYYYGFSGYYNNVSFNPSYRETLTDDEDFHELDGDLPAQAALLWKRLETEGLPLFLQFKYPNAPMITQGVQQYYNITLAVYWPDCETNVTKTYVMRYKVLTPGSAGTPPTFEFVSKTEL